MQDFAAKMHQLVSQALTDLAKAQQSGKIPNNPLSETHYIAAWVTNAIKQKRFDTTLLATLKSWQSQARSKGRNAQLKETFTALQSLYANVLNDGQIKPLHKNQLTGLFTKLAENDWLVTTDQVVAAKTSHHSAGQHALMVCETQLGTFFDSDLALNKPLSLYVRGDVKQLLQFAGEQQLLLHKITDYKSKVKYHGEYLVYPNNCGEFLATLNA